MKQVNRKLLKELNNQVNRLRTYLKIRDELDESNNFVEFNFEGQNHKLSYVPDQGYYIFDDEKLLVETHKVTDHYSCVWKLLNDRSELDEYAEHAESRIRGLLSVH